MSWITVQDLENEYGVEDFPLDENNDPNYSRVENAISDAQLFIEGYLRKAGLNIPASAEVVANVNKATYIITRYYYSFNTILMTDELIREYDSMRMFLSDISSGKTIISDGSDESGGQSGSLKSIDLFII